MSAKKNRKPSVGRIVGFVLGSGEVRPAIIVRVFEDDTGEIVDEGVCNMQVFTNSNGNKGFGDSDGLPPVIWKTGIDYDESHEPNTYHFLD
jgi:hypothetical protein